MPFATLYYAILKLKAANFALRIMYNAVLHNSEKESILDSYILF